MRLRGGEGLLRGGDGDSFRVVGLLAGREPKREAPMGLVSSANEGGRAAW